MSWQREDDYLMREAARLRALVSALLRHRTDPAIEEALAVALQLQTRLFPVPPAEFLAFDATQQFVRLAQGLPPDEAAERCETFAELLFHTATLYDYKHRPELAAGARQHALHIALLTALHLHQSSAASLVRLLRQTVNPDELHAPVRELLAEFDAPSAPP